MIRVCLASNGVHVLDLDMNKYTTEVSHQFTEGGISTLCQNRCYITQQLPITDKLLKVNI